MTVAGEEQDAAEVEEVERLAAVAEESIREAEAERAAERLRALLPATLDDLGGDAA